jgi:hypothetical protein
VFPIATSAALLLLRLPAQLLCHVRTSLLKLQARLLARAGPPSSQPSFGCKCAALFCFLRLEYLVGSHSTFLLARLPAQLLCHGCSSLFELQTPLGAMHAALCHAQVSISLLTVSFSYYGNRSLGEY